MEREPTLYVTLAESRDELEIVAESHEFDIAKVEIFEVKPPELDQTGSDQYTVFHPSEVELVDVMQNILSKMEKTKAGRIVFDSMSEIRMLARDPLRYRRQILSLKQFFIGRKCTVLLEMQPTWSDFPLIILISPARDRESRRPGWPLFAGWEM
jgi:circadian clock protein KaiC